MKRPTIQASITAFRSLSASRREQTLYLLVGIGGFILDITIFYGAIQMQVPVYVAQWMGAGIGFIHNHIWQHYTVFKHTQPFTRTALISLVISIISILLSGPLVAVLASLTGQFLLAKILVVVFQMSILFFVRKYLIFKTHLVSAEHS